MTILWVALGLVFLDQCIGALVQRQHHIRLRRIEVTLANAQVKDAKGEPYV